MMGEMISKSLGGVQPIIYRNMLQVRRSSITGRGHLTKTENMEMALYCTRGIKNSKATIQNYGETKRKWSGTFKDAQIDKKLFKQLSFDTTIKKHECPQDKKALLDLLNSVAHK